MQRWLQVKALEAAEAARRKEALKATERAAQRQQVEAQKAERAKRAQDAKVGMLPKAAVWTGSVWGLLFRAAKEYSMLVSR